MRHRLSCHTWGIEDHTHIKHAETEQIRITLWDVDVKTEYLYRDPREGQPDQTFPMEELPDISYLSYLSRGRPSLSANAAALHDGGTDDVDIEAEDISRDPREGQPDQTVVEEEPPDISDVVRGRPSVSANANAAASHDDDGDTAEARNRRARALMMKEWIVNVNQRLVNIESTVQRIEAMITEQIAETVEAETRAAPWPPAPPRRPRSRSVHRIMRS